MVLEYKKSVDRYAVIGNPVSHSKSPLIHDAFAKQTQQHMSYERVLAPLDGFKNTVDMLINQGFKGVNVTVPFKFEAFECSQNQTLWSTAAKAANTLIFGEAISADNTDGMGLIHDLQKNLGVALKGKRILLLGAGGAASGVLLPLLLEQPANLTIANRTIEKAQLLQNQIQLFAESEPLLDWELMADNFEVTDFLGLNNVEFDLVINATSTGLSDLALPVPNSVFAKQALAYDMMYGRITPFMRQAMMNNIQAVGGLGMLVEQAAEAFYLWRGIRPDTQPVMKYIRDLSR